jgi:hypothetical protein
MEDSHMNSLGHLVAVLGLAAAGVAVAQPPGPPHGGPALDIERLTILLDLDAYQKGEVERLLTEQREQNRAARAALADSDERPSFEDIQARREQSRADLIAKLEGVLTPQQVTKFKVLTERPEGPRGGRGRHAL